MRLAGRGMQCGRAREEKIFEEGGLAGLRLCLLKGNLCLLKELSQLMLGKQVQGGLWLQGWSGCLLSCVGCLHTEQTRLIWRKADFLRRLAHLPRCVRPSDHYPLPTGCVGEICPAVSSLKFARVLRLWCLGKKTEGPQDADIDISSFSHERVII